MKKTLLLLAAVAFSFSSAFAQEDEGEEIIHKVNDGTTGLISTVGNDGAVWAADYFVLEEDVELGKFLFYGFGSGTNNNYSMEEFVTGADFFIFEDDGFGAPDGNPSWEETGAILEYKNLDLAHITLDEETTPGNTYVTIDVASANDGEPVILEAGEYWVSMAPRVSTGHTGTGRWNWSESLSAPKVNEGLLIDPEDLFESGATFWMPISSLIGEDFNTFAWKLNAYNILGVDDFETNSFKHLVKNNQLLISSDLEINNVAIYNSLGQKVASQSVNATSANINLSNLSSGVYFTQADVNGEVKTFKFAK